MRSSFYVCAVFKLCAQLVLFSIFAQVFICVRSSVSINTHLDQGCATQLGQPAQRVLDSHAHKQQVWPLLTYLGLHSVKKPAGMRASTVGNVHKQTNTYSVPVC
jgi:hypothetical protein